jgi:hypothetical protein
MAAGFVAASNALVAEDATDPKPAQKITVAEAVTETRALLQGRRISDLLGVTHTRGQYAFTDKPFLIEGAEAVNPLGAKIIKLLIWCRSHRIWCRSHSKHWRPVTSLTYLGMKSYLSAVFNTIIYF